jgi:hypothetical protein
MLIDRYLPEFDVSELILVDVDAPPSVVFRAIRETDLRDPVVNALFALREAPLRVSRLLHGAPAPPDPGPITFGDFARGGPGWTFLGEDPGVELVIGSVGRFWRRDYGGRPVSQAEFVPFREPGFAKLVVSLAVRPRPSRSGTILRYEARTATTDDEARRLFRRYWRVIRPGVAIVMRRALSRIRKQAERRAQSLVHG